MASDAQSGDADDKYRWQTSFLAGSSGPAQVAPAAENNKGPVLRVLQAYLPPVGHVLEVASGTGQHVAHLARNLPGLSWQPTDIDTSLFGSIAAHTQGLDNVSRPVVLDASWPPAAWKQALGAEPGSYDCVQVANMTHISPWAATEGLVAGAAAMLRPGSGLLTVYGPFKLKGAFTTESNQAFHTRLAASNPAWGYRDTDEVEALARRHGLVLQAIEPMPANNFFLVFKAEGA